MILLDLFSPIKLNTVNRCGSGCVYTYIRSGLTTSSSSDDATNDSDFVVSLFSVGGFSSNGLGSSGVGSSVFFLLAASSDGYKVCLSDLLADHTHYLPWIEHNKQHKEQKAIPNQQHTEPTNMDIH